MVQNSSTLETVISGLPFPPELLLRVIIFCAKDWDTPYIQTLICLRLVCKSWKPLIEEVIVRHTEFSRKAQAQYFFEWVGDNSLASFIKSCVLLPSDSTNAVQLEHFTPFLGTCSNLRSLTINTLYITYVTSLGSYIPSLEELIMKGGAQHPGLGSRSIHFRYLASFIFDLKSLKILNLSSTSFDENDPVFPFPLQSLQLLDCSDYAGGGSIEQVFVNSHSTIQRYSFSPSYRHEIGYRKNAFPIPSFLGSVTPLNGLVLLPGQNNSYRPDPVARISTLCVTSEVLVNCSDSLRPLIGKFLRLVIIALERIDASQLLHSQVSQDSSLRWLEIKKTWFRAPSGFQQATSPLGQFVRVLSLHRVNCVPRDLSRIFPHLEALQVYDITLDIERQEDDLQPGWFGPKLRVFCVVDCRAPGRQDVETVDHVLTTRQCPHLCLFICQKLWAQWKHKNVDHFRQVCSTYGVNIVTIPNEELNSYQNTYEFTRWARHLALA